MAAAAPTLHVVSSINVHRAVLTIAVLAVGAALASGCGSQGAAGTPRITWYINPDNGGQDELARRCTKQAHGRYRLETSLLPRNASDQREQLLRRLAAKDSSIDLMSLDVVLVPEFSQAGFLAPIPQAAAPALTAGDVKPAVRTATWDGRLAAVPMWANTQLLWYRKSVARKAGLAPADRPVTWAQMVRAARASKTTIAVQARLYEGYTVLINALIESAGGRIIENPGANADDIRLGVDSRAGREAANVIAQLASHGVGGPSLSTADEEAARELFQGSTGGFMVNWPYVWPAAQAAVHDGELKRATLADIGWARYPRVDATRASRPPLGGIDLGVGAYSQHPQLALAAARCITSTANQTYYFLHDGNPAARAKVYGDPRVVKAFPMAPLLRQSLEAAAPRPRSDVYGDLSAALQRSFHPPSSVNSSTPAAASKFILAVLRGRRLV
jgi:trehalose/maltose transport system substrate-binding protein